MLEVDGSEGGGQLLRSSLSLATVTGRAVRVTDIRGSRPDPGLRPQHLAAVEAVTAACDGTVENATPGSETLVFEPGEPTGGHVEAAIETAGSLTLVFETLLPLSVRLDEPLSVIATGGTAVKWSPPLATYRLVKLPLCREFGIPVAVERHRTGFYPAGGGKATLHVGPSTPDPISLAERGPPDRAHILSRESRDLADRDVAQRQAETARERLDEAGIDVTETVTATAETDSTGSAVTIALAFENSRAGFDALGEPGTPAESVGGEAVGEAVAFHRSEAAVDRYTADQLLLFLGLAGGEMGIPVVTEHVQSSLELFEVFGLDVSLDESGAVPVVSASGIGV